MFLVSLYIYFVCGFLLVATVEPLLIVVFRFSPGLFWYTMYIHLGDMIAWKTGMLGINSMSGKRKNFHKMKPGKISCHTSCISEYLSYPYYHMNTIIQK